MAPPLTVTSLMTHSTLLVDGLTLLLCRNLLAAKHRPSALILLASRQDLPCEVDARNLR